MNLLSSMWLRTLFWILSSVLSFFCFYNQYLFTDTYIWLIICSFCLFNTYIEYMVIAIFIKPGSAKKSIDSIEWQSHFRDFESISTHIQTFSQQRKAPLVVLIHGWRGTSASVQGRAQWFIENGWHVVICELPGHGKSSGVQRWNALTAAKHMQYHIKNLHLIFDPEIVSHVFFLY